MSGPNAQTKRLSFFKMHSLGNDFMVIDGVSDEFTPDATTIARWSDRHTGIGFDQLLVIEAPTDPAADFWYKVYNADGSQAEQCGNGTRCVAMLVNQLQLSPKSSLVWQSLAGQFLTERNGDQFTTTMTVPVLSDPEIPFLAEQAEQVASHNYKIEDGQDCYTVTPVSMGNPHAVIFVGSTSDLNISDLDVEAIGARLTRHAAFPNHANVGFCQIVDRGFMRLRVYERGTGETLACGSGACAAVVAAQLNNRVGTKVKVSLPGGKLRIVWPGVGERVSMSGPAIVAYKGDVEVHES